MIEYRKEAFKSTSSKLVMSKIVLNQFVTIGNDRKKSRRKIVFSCC